MTVAAFRSCVWSLTAASVIALASAGALAQQAQKGAPTGQTKAAPAPQPKAEPAPAPSADAALRQRVEQLEEQLVDMQVVIGTLESMGRGGASGGGSAPMIASGPARLSAADQARMDQLEQQVRALTTQVEQMGQQARSQPQGSAPVVAAAPPPPPLRPAQPAFSTTVIPPDRDPISSIIGGGNVPGAQAPGQTATNQSTPPAPLPQAQASDASARQLYDTAYGLLLQQDYAAAETGFDEFLRRFPNDALAGNAQYWLGETFYVRGQFKQAAGAFLKGYQTYGRSSKAPDSLLKLAMSLDRLGQRDAACSSYGELSIKFPNAPGAVKARADNERRRLACA